MAAARQEIYYSVNLTARNETQVSLYLHLLQDHQGFKLVETGFSFAFLDINPIAKGHALVIPKDHTEKMHELSDEYLADALPIARKIALAQGLDNYNILQNNGRIAHQHVDHVHFHVIPKPNGTEGLVFTQECWPAQNPSMDDLKAYHAELLGKLGKL